MKQVLGFRLSRQAKFWLDAGDRDGKFLWVWFVPIGDVVVVVEETWKRGGQPSYKVKWWDIEELEQLLSENYSGAHSYKGYKLEKMAAVIENWTEDEKQKGKEFWELHRMYARGEQSEELLKAYNKGIRKGYYLLPCF